MSILQFRLLIVGAILCGVASAVVAIAFPSMISANILKALEAEPISPFIEDYPVVLGILSLVWLVASIAGTVGLVLLKPWARSLAFYSTVAGFTVYPLFGTTVTSALVAALSEAAFVLWGAVLALSYYGPIGEHFRGRDGAER